MKKVRTFELPWMLGYALLEGEVIKKIAYMGLQLLPKEERIPAKRTTTYYVVASEEEIIEIYTLISELLFYGVKAV